MESCAPVDFELECRDLGAACARAKFRNDKGAPAAYREAHAAYAGARNVPPYYDRKCLSLRLSAVKRGMVVDQTVTPEFLERVTDGRCPVTLEPFSTTGKSDSKPSVDRLVNEVTYRAGNICVMSKRANRAKGERSFEEVAQLAQAGERRDGLEAVEWMRLASLMYGAWARAYRCSDPHLLPLAAMPGPGMFVSTSQAVQMLLTRQYSNADDASAATTRWLELTREAQCPDTAFCALSEKLTLALADEKHPGNAWLHGAVFEAFVTWYNASRAVVVPAVERLLHKHQARAGDAVAALEWPNTSRYMV